MIEHGVMMGQPKGQSRWSVLITYDESLNFAIYVGCYYGFLTEDMCSGRTQLWPTCFCDDYKSSSNFSALQKQWHQWWLELTEVRASRISRGDGYPLSEFFSPPEFSTVKPSEFAVCLKNVWPLFQEWWGMPAGGSSALAHWESMANVHNHTSHVEATLGRKLKEFNLTIDLIYTGMTDVYEINPQHVLVTPLIVLDNNWWNKKILELG